LRVLVLGPFARDLRKVDRGSEIRAHYLAEGLESMGLTVFRVARDLTPWSLARSGGASRLPAALRRADAIVVVGIPWRRLPYEVLTRLLGPRKPLVLDFNDDPILQYRFILGGETPKVSAYRKFEDFFVRKATAVAFLTEPMRDYYLEAWGAKDSVDTLLLPNATDPDHFRPSPLPEAPTIGFLGGLGPGRGMDLVAAALRELRASGLRVTARIGYASSFRLGANSTRAVLGSEIAAGTVELVSGVDYARAPDFLRGLRVCLIPHARNTYMDFAMPIKLFDYMAAARPIVATDNPEVARIVRDRGSGLVASAEPGAFAEAVAHLLEDRSDAERRGRLGRKAVEDRDNWRNVARLLADALAKSA